MNTSQSDKYLTQHPPPRPLLPVAIAFIIGILLADKGLLSGEIPLVLLLVLSLGFGVLYLFNRLHLIRLICLLLLCLIAGAFRFQATYRLPAEHIANFSAQRVSVTLTGVVSEEPRITVQPSPAHKSYVRGDWLWRKETRGSFVITAEIISAKPACRSGRGETNRVTGLVKVSFSKFTPDVTYGDRVEILGRIYSPHPPSNPGQFDYAKYLKKKGIYKVISLVKPEDIRILEKNQWYHPWWDNTTGGNPILGIIYKVRNGLSQKIDANFPDHQKSGFLKALLLGKRDALSEELEDKFRKSGTIHLLAVSGLHIALVLGFFFWLTHLIGLRGRGRAILLILVTLFYMVLTGLLTPVIRAGVMALVFFSAELFRRKREPINTLALAALIMLIINPNDIFSIGFQLSFTCVLMIIVFSKHLFRLFPSEDPLVARIIPRTIPGKIIRWLKIYLFNALAVSLAAWLGSVPLIMKSFHFFTPITVLANIIIAPLIFVILGVGLLMLPWLMIGLSTPITETITGGLWLSDFLHNCAVKIGGYFYLPDLPVWLLLTYYSVVSLWFLQPYLVIGKKIILKQKYLLGLSAGIILCFVVWGLFPIKVKSQAPILTMLDVRHGGAFFMEFPDGKRMLYDAGSFGSFDVGEGIIAPFLWRKGITRIDTLILSHPQLDHINAVPSLLERFSIGQVIVSSWFSHREIGRKMIELIQGYHIPIKEVYRGDVISLAEGVTGKILGPPCFEEVEETGKSFRENDLSIVLWIKHQGKALLLTGDIQSIGIQWLTQSTGGNIKSEVMQVPHHGFAEPYTLKLIEAVKPGYSLVNTSPYDVADDVLTLYRQSGAEVLTSYQHGAVTIRFAPDGIKTTPHLLLPK